MLLLSVKLKLLKNTYITRQCFSKLQIHSQYAIEKKNINTKAFSNVEETFTKIQSKLRIREVFRYRQKSLVEEKLENNRFFKINTLKKKLC